MEPLHTVGELADRTGVPARTIRFWSDEGLVPPSERSPAGYRRYDAAAVARLDLVRTLRELGLGHEEVREVLAGRRDVAEVAAAHVAALDRRIHALRAQRAVCALLARGDHDEKGTILMNDLARLSAEQRQQMIDEFVAETFAGIDPDAPGADIADGMRRMPPTLPTDPSDEQVAAWVELAELVGDPDFRARCREMATTGAATPERPYDVEAVVEHAGAARRAGVDPSAPQAAAVLDRIGVADRDATGRAELADTVDTFSDRRVERYWTLLGRLHGWPEREPLVPVFEWFARALREAPGR